MWKVWLIFDPRRGLIAILSFAFFMVMLIHFIQFSTPRYGSWQQQLPANAPAAAAAVATP